MLDEQQAISGIGSSGPAPVSLIEEVGRIPARRSRRVWLAPSLMLTLFIAEIVIVTTTGRLDSDGWAILPLFLLTFGAGTWWWIARSVRERRSIEQLSSCRDIRGLGSLLGCAPFVTGRTRKCMESAMVDMLPSVSEESGVLLTTAHRELLNSLLYYSLHDVSIAAFAALERVGDSTALPYLSSIANGKGIPPALKNYSADAQARAQNAVTTIRARIELQNRSNVLLRASGAPGTREAELVRPASVHQQPYDELMRAEIAYTSPDIEEKKP